MKIIEQEKLGRSRAGIIRMRYWLLKPRSFYNPAESSVITTHCSLLTNKSGVALILVLGTLSLMLIMAVSFAISMRTARLASGNYADTVRARQLVQVGLVRAMDDIRGMMGSNLNAAGAQVYPPWSVTNARNGAELGGEYAVLLTTNANTATNFIPGALNSADNAQKLNHWVEIREPSNNMLIGRVAYLILNCSGLLDANFAGGAGRGYGTNPAELAVASLPEIGAGANNLLNNRLLNIRYESVAELHEYSGSSTPSNFFVYSYCSNGWWNGATNLLPVNLAGGVAQLTVAGRKNAILAGFTNAGYSGLEAGILFSNLLDYVDGNSVPTNQVSSVEAVPMVNEVVVSNLISVADSSATPGNKIYTIKTDVFVEWWYPFVNDAALPFDLSVEVGFGEANNLKPANLPVAAKPLGMPPAESLNFIHLNCPPVSVDRLPVNSISLVSTSSLSVKQGADVVDSLAGLMILTNVNNGVQNNGLYSSCSVMQCIDPRFNYFLDPAAGCWTNAPPASLGATNPATIAWWARNPNNDTNSAMYVANRTLRLAGEVGCLACAPWKTVKFYGPARTRALDAFAIGTNDTDVFVTHSRRGLVNPNSLQSNVLAAVFAGMPVDDYPGGPSNSLSLASALTIAGRLANGGVYTNLSDIGQALTNFSALNVTLDNELKKESLFRNAAGLLSARQNVFQVIIEAQLAYGNMYPRYKNLAHQRAVAIVWRDPYTGEFFVRSFQWMED